MERCFGTVHSMERYVGTVQVRSCKRFKSGAKESC
jgi:hypothetical protein